MFDQLTRVIVISCTYIVNKQSSQRKTSKSLNLTSDEIMVTFLLLYGRFQFLKLVNMLNQSGIILVL